MTDCFRTRLRRGDTLVGPIVTINSPEVVEVLDEVGFDWLFLDGEHAPLSPGHLQRLMIAARRTPCVVRMTNSGSSRRSTAARPASSRRW
jgi:2-dehydro-3-deoxyglucarate aldolase